MRRYLVNGRVLTMAPVEGGNKKTGKKQEYRNGFIGIEDGKIVQMGEMEELGKVPERWANGCNRCRRTADNAGDN